MPYWFDGNNLIGQSAAASRRDPRLQREFLSALNACRKSMGGRFLVYFDGDDPDCTAPPPEVSVRYSAPLSADEAIIRGLREIRYPREVTVVSNDRDLRMRCRSEGATAMTWQEFTLKMKTGARHQEPENEKSQTGNLEDWMRYFGLDKL